MNRRKIKNFLLGIVSDERTFGDVRYLLQILEVQCLCQLDLEISQQRGRFVTLAKKEIKFEMSWNDLHTHRRMILTLVCLKSAVCKSVVDKTNRSLRFALLNQYVESSNSGPFSFLSQFVLVSKWKTQIYLTLSSPLVSIRLGILSRISNRVGIGRLTG